MTFSYHVCMGWLYISCSELNMWLIKSLFCESYHMFPSLHQHNSGHSFLWVILPFLHHPLYATSLLSFAAIHLFPNNALWFHHIYLYPQQITAAHLCRRNVFESLSCSPLWVHSSLIFWHWALISPPDFNILNMRGLQCIVMWLKLLWQRVCYQII